jgi:hypothetical protein
MAISSQVVTKPDAGSPNVAASLVNGPEVSWDALLAELPFLGIRMS